MEDEAPQKASSNFEVHGELGRLAFFEAHAGTEIPADLGTKVLSFEKFKFLKAAMGMVLGSQKEMEVREKRVKEQVEKKGRTQKRPSRPSSCLPPLHKSTGRGIHPVHGLFLWNDV